MDHQIKRYQVQNPLLKKYIRFFWEHRMYNAQINHKIVPQRNINLRFNLNDTPHFLWKPDRVMLLEDVYFGGLHNQYTQIHLKLSGDVDILGICFQADGFYPFINIPVSEFKNQILGAAEIGFKPAVIINQRLKEANHISKRLEILERELLIVLKNSYQIPENFRNLFHSFQQTGNNQLHEFCVNNNISLRKMERMYLRYVGLSASSYNTLNRFHNSLNQLLHLGFSKLSDIGYDNDYFDQVHFIKEFKRFTGCTPGSFIQQNNSVLQIGKLV